MKCIICDKNVKNETLYAAWYCSKHIKRGDDYERERIIEADTKTYIREIMKELKIETEFPNDDSMYEFWIGYKGTEVLASKFIKHKRDKKEPKK